MSQSALGANDAWQWIASGYRMSWKKPAVALISTVICVVIVFLLVQIPLIGWFLTLLLVPALSYFVLSALHKVDAAEAFSSKPWLSILSDSPRLAHVVQLGLVPLSVALVLQAFSLLAMPKALAVVIGMLLWSACACALLFSLPGVALDHKKPVDALRESIRACIHQPVAIGVFFGLAALFAILVLLTLGLGLLVYWPIMVGAASAGYRQALRAA